MKSTGANASRRATALRYHERASDLFIASDPNKPGARKTLREALVNANRALLLKPEDYDTLVLKGKIFFALGDRLSIRQAQECYNRAIAAYPENSDAYSGKADLLMYDLDSPEEAESMARKALSLAQRDHEDPDLVEMKYLGLLDILEGRGKLREAKWLLRQALRNHPSEMMKEMAEITLKRMKGALL